MKTSNEFFERLGNDEAFAKDVTEAVKAKREAGAKNYYETFIPIAQERGYEISKEELDAIYESRTAELSDDELGKIAGGTSCIPVTASITFSAIVVSSISISVATLTFRD